MKYVIIRDDDTNALTPIDYLERLYRPFLDRAQPVNLAVIPKVKTHVTYGDNILEGFLVARNGAKEEFLPIGSNHKLVDYLHSNPHYCYAQHGCTHEFINGNCEFELDEAEETERRILEGRKFLIDAGFAAPSAFVAPYDRFTRTSVKETARHFSLISTGWFEARKLPRMWWPGHFRRKLAKAHHWRAGNTILLSHPGCHLSYHHPPEDILKKIEASVNDRRLTVLVTHWWEYFPNNQPNDRFIQALHETSEYLARRKDVKVVSFEEVAQGQTPLA